MKPSERKIIEIALRNAEETVAQLKRILAGNPKPVKIVAATKFSPWDMHCAEYLNQALQANIKGYKPRKEDELNNWADDFRKLREINGYDETEVGEVLQWAVRDNFWKTVIRSGSKFRDKYETLLAQMNSSNGAPNLL